MHSNQKRALEWLRVKISIIATGVFFEEDNVKVLIASPEIERLINCNILQIYSGNLFRYVGSVDGIISHNISILVFIIQLLYRKQEDEDVAIPLTITLLVIFGYIALGAVMFGMWEGWEAMAAAYFCFITISTIGFGDIVPGAAAKGVKATSDAVKLMVVAIYIFAGMAIISMAFNLIQVSTARQCVCDMTSQNKILQTVNQKN